MRVKFKKYMRTYATNRSRLRIQAAGTSKLENLPSIRHAGIRSEVSTQHKATPWERIPGSLRIENGTRPNRQVRARFRLLDIWVALRSGLE